jgi:hypothetical protein
MSTGNTVVIVIAFSPRSQLRLFNTGKQLELEEVAEKTKTIHEPTRNSTNKMFSSAYFV